MKRPVIGALIVALAFILTPGNSGAYFHPGAPLPPVVASPSATTVQVSWTTGAAGTTTVSVGTTLGSYTIPAVANGTQTGATNHTAIVAGLVPSTLYFGKASSGGVDILFQATTTALLASTPIISLTIGGTPTEPVPDQTEADTFYNCVSNDNVTYIASDDTAFGWGGDPSSNFNFGKFTSESPLTGAHVNAMTNFGGAFTHNGTDNSSAKQAGMFCLDGKIYLGLNRINNAAIFSSPLFGIYPEDAGNIMMSADHGETWANWQDHTTVVANGAVATPPAANMFPTTLILPSPTFVMYGPDTGTINPRVDNQDAYVYIASPSPNWDNGDNMYLARVPRSLMPNLNPADYQYYIGGGPHARSTPRGHRAARQLHQF